MKKQFLFFGAALITFCTNAQLHADFENVTLAPESAWYGQDQVTDGDTILQDGIYSFQNNYNSAWGSFGGWAVSNVTDNTTTGWSNQYSAITGAGTDGSENYGLCYVNAWNGNRIYNTLTGAWAMEYMYVTNTTYAYYSMLNGDAYTKPFGADTNALGMIDGTNGEDWFLLTIFGIGEDSLRTGDSVNFYLADFRFANDADDYIVDEWTLVDLTSLGNVKGIEFELSSTDTTGGWGMNNPAYFAMDNLMVSLSVEENKTDLVRAYPNPVQTLLNVDVPGGTIIQIFSSDGKLVSEQLIETTSAMIDFSNFNSGIYLLNAVTPTGENFTQKILH